MAQGLGVSRPTICAAALGPLLSGRAVPLLVNSAH